MLPLFRYYQDFQELVLCSDNVKYYVASALMIHHNAYDIV